jgi:molybdate transport system substrate-binding protein
VRGLGCAAAIMVMAAATPSMAQETVRLHAAGSLRGALTEVIKGFEAESDLKVEAKYGPSGLLRKEIGDGAKAGVFASANMEHPAALAKDGKSGPVSMFARNRLCALVKSGLAVTPATLFEKMLDPRDQTRHLDANAFLPG